MRLSFLAAEEMNLLDSGQPPLLLVVEDFLFENRSTTHSLGYW